MQCRKMYLVESVCDFWSHHWCWCWCSTGWWIQEVEFIDIEMKWHIRPAQAQLNYTATFGFISLCATFDFLFCIQDHELNDEPFICQLSKLLRIRGDAFIYRHTTLKSEVSIEKQASCMELAVWCTHGVIVFSMSPMLCTIAGIEWWINLFPELYCFCFLLI